MEKRKQTTPFGLRMKPELRAQVKASADSNNRSMNNEIVHRLSKSYEEEEREVSENK